MEHGNSTCPSPSTSSEWTDELTRGARFTSNSFHSKMGKKIQEFYDGDRLCDVSIECSGEVFKAHRVVLAAASDYFSAMFTSGLNESKQSFVSLKDIESRAFRQLLKFCYSGILDVDPSNVEDLVRGACLLQFPEVVDVCTDFMKTQLHPSNSLGIRQFADLQNCSQLAKAAYSYSLNHFCEVMKSEEFLMLSECDLLKLLSSDDLNVSQETQVFDALQAWIRYDLLSRRQIAGKMLNCVRLAFVSPSFIVDRIEGDSIFGEDRTAQSMIINALKYHLMPERRLQCGSIGRERIRKATVGYIFVVAGGSAYRGSLSIEQYDPLRNEWAIAGEMNGRRLQFGVAVIDDHIYVVGGRDGLKTLNSFDCWDPKSGQWYQMPQMITSRHGLGVAILERSLYAAGGHDGWAYLCSVERWDPESKSWSFVAEMNSARNTAGVAVLDGRLYAIGGRDSSQVLRSVERYNPHTNKWTLAAPMNKRRANVGVGVLNGFIYAVGGSDAPASNPGSARFDCVERYDPTADKWTLIASLSCGRDGVSVCPLGDRLLAIGGFDGQNYLGVVELYDPEEDTWTALSSLRTGRAGSGVVLLDRKCVPKLQVDEFMQQLTVCSSPAKSYAS